MSPTTRTGFLLGAFIATVLVAISVQSQAPMLDYESSEKATQIRDSAAWRLAFRPSLSVLQQTVSQLRSAPGLTPTLLAEVEGLMAKAANETEAEARATLWQAVALLNGRTWSADEALLGALALRTQSPIWTGANDELKIDSLYEARATGPVSFSIDLLASTPTASATPKRGELAKALARGRLGGSYPQRIPVPLAGVPDGSYLAIATISLSSGATTQIAQSLFLIRDLEQRYAAFKAILEKLPGHEEARWLAEYPFALAKAVNAGQREVISYDFPRAMERSSRIVAALGSGQDPVRQARGLQNRAYRFEETGELIPFQVYVPTTWSPDKKWPLVIALHGANLDETNMLERDGGRMQQLAEQHGFIVAAPLGYRMNSGYGSQRGLGPIVGRDTQRLVRSEKDVLLVSELVEREYNVNPQRRYLTGNSMGGGGTWWIGGRYVDRWAAIAPSAYGGVLPEDVANLSRVPILAVVGDRDEVGMLDRVRAAVATLRGGGVNPEYIEVPGGTHAGAFETTLPQIFQFFDKHSR